MAKTEPPKAAPKKTKTDRVYVTLPDFVLFELNGLTGIYGPTLPEVSAWIIQAWLHDNQAEIEVRKRQFREYEGSRE